MPSRFLRAAFVKREDVPPLLGVSSAHHGSFEPVSELVVGIDEGDAETKLRRHLACEFEGDGGCHRVRLDFERPDGTRETLIQDRMETDPGPWVFFGTITPILIKPGRHRILVLLDGKEVGAVRMDVWHKAPPSTDLCVNPLLPNDSG